MKEKEPSIPAMMTIDKDEEIAGMWVSPDIPGIGLYKLLAKRNVKGTYEWVHFLQKPDGFKKHLFNGIVDTKEELQNVVAAANKTLSLVFGSNVQLAVGNPTFYSTDGSKHNDTIH